MQALGPYDGRLQMFIQELPEADARRLRFLRWLAEQGQLEHDIAGPPSGSYVSATSPVHPRPRPKG